jgi:hypothetical protein
VRRDCEPHRAEWLLLLGNASVICGIVGIAFIAPSLLGLPLGAYVCRSAHRDLNLMERGMMDPRGRDQTTAAAEKGRTGAMLSLMWAVVGLVLALVYLAVRVTTALLLDG